MHPETCVFGCGGCFPWIFSFLTDLFVWISGRVDWLPGLLHKIYLSLS